MALVLLLGGSLAGAGLLAHQEVTNALLLLQGIYDVTTANWTAALSEHSALGTTLALAWTALTLFLLDRLGLVAYLGACVVLVTYHTYPFTLDPARPYFPVSLAAIAGLVALALLAAAAARGRVPRVAPAMTAR